jgi:hypothetical protein
VRDVLFEPKPEKSGLIMIIGTDFSGLNLKATQQMACHPELVEG